MVKYYWLQRDHIVPPVGFLALLIVGGRLSVPRGAWRVILFTERNALMDDNPYPGRTVEEVNRFLDGVILLNMFIPGWHEHIDESLLNNRNHDVLEQLKSSLSKALLSVSFLDSHRSRLGFIQENCDLWIEQVVSHRNQEEENS